MSDTVPVLGGAHPLDPLTIDELESTRDVLVTAGILHERAQVTTVTLAEPPKPDVLAWPGKPIARHAEAVVLDRHRQSAAEVIVDLDAKTVISSTDLEGRQPSFTVEEFMAGIMLTKADPRWQEAMRRRGVSDFDQVQVDMWSTGTFVPEGMSGSPARPLRLVPPTEPARQRLCPTAPGRRRDRRRRHATRWCPSTTTGSSRSRRPTATTTSRRTDVRSGSRPQAARHHPAGGPQLHRRRPPRPVAGMGLPGVGPPARRPDPPPGGV